MPFLQNDQRVPTVVRETLEQLPLAVTIVDLEGRMLGYNRRAEDLLDRRPELLGEDVRTCHRCEESNVKIDRMLEAFREGDRQPFCYEADRYGKRLRVTFTPIEAGDELLGCIQSVTVLE